jgi:Rrf2 family transcriptional regulator, iron-sulfur cluster assembly transcription factor
MISQTGKYALRILGYLADRPSEWILSKEIAHATGIPANYLSKILAQLCRQGYVRSQKGWGGGFLMRKEAMQLPILEIIRVFEGPQNKQECLYGLPRCDADHPCPLHGHWETIRNSYSSMLQSTTIGDLRSCTLAETIPKSG